MHVRHLMGRKGESGMTIILAAASNGSAERGWMRGEGIGVKVAVNEKERETETEKGDAAFLGFGGGK